MLKLDNKLKDSEFLNLTGEQAPLGVIPTSAAAHTLATTVTTGPVSTFSLATRNRAVTNTTVSDQRSTMVPGHMGSATKVPLDKVFTDARGQRYRLWTEGEVGINIPDNTPGG